MSSKETYYGLPSDVKYCNRCVISNQRPSSTIEFKNSKGIKKETILFNDEGICAACEYADIKEQKINWNEREDALWKLCNHHRSKKGNYDCIIP